MSSRRGLVFTALAGVMLVAALLGVRTSSSAERLRPPTIGRAFAAPAVAARPAAVRHRRRHVPTFTIEQVRPGTVVVLRDRPGGQVMAREGARTAFGSPQTLTVASRKGPWLGVMSADLPNGRLGWVDSRNATVTAVRTHISIRVYLARRELDLVDGSAVVRRMIVGVGSAGFDTPATRFSVTDKLLGAEFSRGYGCCILALSGHQPVTPPGWPGGNRLAIHGTDDPSYIGTPSSAGCLIGDGEDLAVLMRKVPLGAPVFIRA